jgi:hypothetical protein
VAKVGHHLHRKSEHYLPEFEGVTIYGHFCLFRLHMVVTESFIFGPFSMKQAMIAQPLPAILILKLNRVEKDRNNVILAQKALKNV